MKDITDADYAHAKRNCEGFEINNLAECHDLYVESDTLLLANVFENFRNMSIYICEVDPARFLTAPGTSSFKKDQRKVRFLTDIDTILTVEKVFRGGVCDSIY